MEPLNTYTYRQSELPPMTAEVQTEIAEIDFNVANLILKIQGNYLALNSLVETLADGLNSAESNLCSIRIIPDGGDNEPVQRAISLTDLPMLEKQMVISTAVTSTVSIKLISTFLGCSFEQAAAHVSTISDNHLGGMSPDQVEKAIAALQKQLRQNSGKQAFVVSIENPETEN